MPVSNNEHQRIDGESTDLISYGIHCQSHEITL